MMPLLKQPLIRRLLLLCLVFLLGGLGGVVFDRIIIPRVAAYEPFAHIDFFRKAADRVTVINRTEQVIVREDESLATIVSQPGNAVVTVVRTVTPVKTNQADVFRPAEAATVQNGVLLTNDGLLTVPFERDPVTEGIATNVILYDGSTFSAEFVGYDRLIGFAFFRIAAENVPAISFANSDDVAVGRKVIAIARADADREARFATGMVTGMGRTVNLAGKTVASSEKWEGVLLSDISESGFIGSPAVQYNGEMVGIFGALTIDGVKSAYLLPANALRMSLDRALAGTLKERAALGVYYLSLTRTNALAFGYDNDQGALIYAPSGKTGLAVLAGSPAERAGLRIGDIIVAVGSDAVDIDHPLSVRIGQRSAGDTVDLMVLRNSREETIPVTFPSL